MQARRLPARHGLLWLLAGFRLFRANPPLLTALTMAYLFVIVAMNLLPLIGPFLVPLVLPALVVVLANGCRAIERGGGVGSVALTLGLQKQRVPLIRLGGLHLVGSLFILAASTLLEGGQPSLGAPGRSPDEEQVLAMMGRLLVLALPVVSAFWFAPLLTAWDGVSPPKSVFFSFVACWRNWRAFIVFLASVLAVAIAVPGLLLIVAGALSAVAVNVLSIALKMLLIFVLAPVLMAGVYISYQDVFHGPAGGE